MKEMSGKWKWISEADMHAIGHCIGLLEGSNRKVSLRGCLIWLNLEFDISFRFYCYSTSISCLFISIQVCTYWQNDCVEFVRLEELNTPTARTIEGEKGLEW